MTGCEVGGSKPGDLSVETLNASFDAVVLAVGALRGRDAPDIPGRSLSGVHMAMDHLVPANRACEGDGPPPPHHDIYSIEDLAQPHRETLAHDLAVRGGSNTRAAWWRQPEHSRTTWRHPPGDVLV